MTEPILTYDLRVSDGGTGDTTRWQPIETAPRDGTQILAWFAPDWRPAGYAIVSWSGCWCYDGGGAGPSCEGVTHWMLLPCPPES